MATSECAASYLVRVSSGAGVCVRCRVTLVRACASSCSLAGAMWRGACQHEFVRSRETGGREGVVGFRKGPFFTRYSPLPQPGTA